MTAGAESEAERRADWIARQSVSGVGVAAPPRAAAEGDRSDRQLVDELRLAAAQSATCPHDDPECEHWRAVDDAMMALLGRFNSIRRRGGEALNRAESAESEQMLAECAARDARKERDHANAECRRVWSAAQRMATALEDYLHCGLSLPHRVPLHVALQAWRDATETPMSCGDWMGQ